MNRVTQHQLHGFLTIDRQVGLIRNSFNMNSYR